MLPQEARTAAGPLEQLERESAPMWLLHNSRGII
jgi:hypothetical protein